MKTTELALNVTFISQALFGSTDYKDEVIEIFSDGRNVSRLSETWVCDIYEVTRKGNDCPSHDGVVNHPLAGGETVSIRSLTKSGIKFQDSKYIGSKRSCTQDILLAGLEKKDYVIVVDICDFPKIRMIPVSTKDLLKKAEAGCLKPSGWKRKKFYKEMLGQSPSEFEADQLKSLNQ